MFFYNLGDQVEDERRMDTASFYDNGCPGIKVHFSVRVLALGIICISLLYLSHKSKIFLFIGNI